MITITTSHTIFGETTAGGDIVRIVGLLTCMDAAGLGISMEDIMVGDMDSLILGTILCIGDSTMVAILIPTIYGAILGGMDHHGITRVHTMAVDMVAMVDTADTMVVVLLQPVEGEISDIRV